MPLNLKDLMKKAKDKGIDSTRVPSSSFTRPWQQESVLFNKIEEKLEHSKSLDLNGTQIEHNKDTIGTQNIVQDGPHIPVIPDISNEIRTQLEHKRDTIRTHKDNKRNTKETQTEHKKLTKDTIGTQQEHGKEHTLEHIRNTIDIHKEHIKDTKYSLNYLSGIQKQLVVYFYLSCKKTRSRTTEEFSITNLAAALDIRLGSIKTSLRRLEEKGFIQSMQFKKGRGGWTQFELPDYIYRELLEKEHNWNTSGTQQDHKWDTERNTEKDTIPSSSSSYLKETTTNIPTEWDFDVTPYEKFGFTKTHIKQLIPLGNIQAQDVQQSLIEFLYDYETNHLPRLKTGPINLLMGLFRKGSVYLSVHYKSEQDEMERLMIERAKERQRTQLEEKFVLWESKLSEVDKQKIRNKMPTYLMVAFDSFGSANKDVREWLINYFCEQI